MSREFMNESPLFALLVTAGVLAGTAAILGVGSYVHTWWTLRRWHRLRECTDVELRKLAAQTHAPTERQREALAYDDPGSNG